MVAHGEELALDEIGLGGAAQADGDIGLAHGEIELGVIEDQDDVDLGVELHEFRNAGGEPEGAEADRGVMRSSPSACPSSPSGASGRRPAW